MPTETQHLKLNIPSDGDYVADDLFWKDNMEEIDRHISDITINVESFPLISPETDDTGRVQRAINHLRDLGGGKLSFTKPLYQIKQVEIFSNITFYSDKNSVIKSLDAGISTGDHAMFHSKYATQDLKNVHFNGLTFDGNRLNIVYDYYHLIGVWVEDGRRLDNFTVTDCTFFDAKEDFIRITGKDSTAKADTIKIKDCKFYGVNVDYNDYAGNALRVVLNRYTASNYGYVFATNITVDDCYAEKIRTLADLKRGCKSFVVTKCKTKNMYDIDHSCDGAFSGRFFGNETEQDESFTPVDSHNAFELQGEDLQVYGNEIGYKKSNGVLVTDYGHPDELNNLGHVSKNIKVFGNVIKKVGGTGVKSVNADGLEFTDNKIIESLTPVIVDSGTGRKDSLGATLTAGRSFLANNRYSKYGYGLILKGNKPILGAGNVDDNGQVSIQYSTSPTMYVENKARELNFNPDLEIDFATTHIKYWNFGANVVAASSKPIGTLRAVTIDDTSTSSLAEVLPSDFYIPCKKDSIIHLGLYAKQNTATVFGMVIKEYAGTTWLKNTFLPVPISANWSRFRTCYKATEATCDNLIVSLLPAASSNAPANTGKTDIALLNISDQPLN